MVVVVVIVYLLKVNGVGIVWVVWEDVVVNVGVVEYGNGVGKVCIFILIGYMYLVSFEVGCGVLCVVGVYGIVVL